MKKKKMITFVIPVYNEQEALLCFYEELLMPEISKLKFNYEIIFVNDCSSDNSLSILQEIAKDDSRIRIITFSRNFGKEIALVAGIKEASGNAIIMLDSDGQQPPVLIHEMIERWRKGADIVVGVRGKFEKHGLIAKIGSKLFYKILRIMGVKDTIPGSTDFRLISRNVAKEYSKLTEHGRITRGLMDWMGFQKSYIDYVCGNRLAGRPSYNFKKLFRLAIDSFVSLSTTPLILFCWIGTLITVLSGMLGLFILIEEFILSDPLGIKWTGTTCVCIFITFLIGLLLISNGVTALYISHIHIETQNRPLYIINKKESYNLKKKTGKR